MFFTHAALMRSCCSFCHSIFMNPLWPNACPRLFQRRIPSWSYPHAMNPFVRFQSSIVPVNAGQLNTPARDDDQLLHIATSGRSSTKHEPNLWMKCLVNGTVVKKIASPLRYEAAVSNPSENFMYPSVFGNWVQNAVSMS